MSKLIGMYRCWTTSGIQRGEHYDYSLSRRTASWDYFQEPVIVEIPDGFEPAESGDGLMRLYGPDGCVVEMTGTKAGWTDNSKLMLCDGGENPLATVIRMATGEDDSLFV